MAFVPWVITILALSTSLVGWLAKLWWSKEYRSAKEAEIQSLKTQIENLRDLTPMRLQEYAKATGEMLGQEIDDLQLKLTEANDRVQVSQNLIANLQTIGATELKRREEAITEIAEMKDRASVLENQIEALQRDRNAVVHLSTESTRDMTRWFWERAEALRRNEGLSATIAQQTDDEGHPQLAAGPWKGGKCPYLMTKGTSINLKNGNTPTVGSHPGTAKYGRCLH